MKHILTFSLILAVVLSIPACNSTDGTAESTDSTTVSTAIDSANDSAPPASGEVSVSGKITDVADAGYPLAIVRVEVPGQAEPLEFTLSSELSEGRFSVDNIQGINGRSVNDLVGKTVDLRYKMTQKMALMDLELNGKSLMDDQSPAKQPGWQKITGTLSGAETESGDLPGTISVAGKDGSKIEFECFVSGEIQKANKKEVTAWYEQREDNELTYMQVTP